MAKNSRTRSRAASDHRARRRIRRPAGLAPGTLIVSPTAAKVAIRTIGFDPERCEEREDVSVDELPALLGRTAVTWVDITGLGDSETLHQLAGLFGIHPLALEDVAHVGQRPKQERYGEELLIFARMTDEVARLEEPLASEQLCLLLRPGLVVTFQERPGDGFDPVRNRIRTGASRVRTSGADYLAYALLDTVVDRYVLLLDDYEETLEDIEEALLSAPSNRELEHLHRVRRDLITLRHLAAPLREVLSQLQHDDTKTAAFTADTQLFLRDCHDHAVRTVEQIDANREMTNSLLEMYLSTVSHRTNEAMKTLTIIATLFIPLSFIVGVYGMNFDTASPWNMPELRWRFGYPTVLLMLAGVLVGLLGFLKRKGLI